MNAYLGHINVTRMLIARTKNHHMNVLASLVTLGMVFVVVSVRISCALFHISEY